MKIYLIVVFGFVASCFGDPKSEVKKQEPQLKGDLVVKTLSPRKNLASFCPVPPDMTDNCAIGKEFCFVENDSRFPIMEMEDCSGAKYAYSRFLCEEYELLIEDDTTPKTIKCLPSRNFPDLCECEQRTCEEYEKVCDTDKIIATIKEEFF